MTGIHGAILEFLREHNDPRLEKFATLSDEQLIHRIFSNHRGRRGIRLTHFGLQVLQSYFESYEVKVPKDVTIKTTDLMFLDERATLPYYCDDARIVVFDHELGVKLRLVDGRLSTLVNIETF